jgi:hypothetical protein
MGQIILKDLSYKNILSIKYLDLYESSKNIYRSKECPNFFQIKEEMKRQRKVLNYFSWR